MEFTDKPLAPFGETILDLATPTQLSLKSALVFRMLKELSSRRCLPPDGHPQVELCFEEVLANAMLHGNKLDPGRTVRVVLCADAERWGAIVEDEGDGFKASDIPDPDGLEASLRETGRGIRLMDGALDELPYSQKGNRVLLIRRRQPRAEGQEAEGPVAAAPAAEPEPAAPTGPVSARLDGEVHVLAVHAPRLGDEAVSALREAISRTTGRLMLLDLSRVTFLSSMGIGALVHVHKAVATRQGRLVLTGLRPAVRDTLKAVKMLAVFQTLPDLESGLAELRRPGA